MKIKLLLVFLISCFVFLNSNSGFSQHEFIESVTVKSGIKAVWKVKDNIWEAGVGAGLRYPNFMTEKYESMDITKSDYLMSVVIHDKAGYWLLTDDAYKEFTKSNESNPNIGLVNTLLQKGVSVELCGVTMENNKWKPEQILPGVKILVKGAYARIIDLQMQGYGYIGL